MTRNSIELSAHLDTVAGRLAYVISVGFRCFGSDRLREFARARHGWGDSDGGNGVTYPSDLDEYDKVTLDEPISDGQVQIYALWGPEKGGFEDTILEVDYLAELEKQLGHIPP